jgi:DNA-binding CsgD family transcriptional regulator
MIDAGARLRRDYREHFDGIGSATLKSLRPRLVGLTKEEAEEHPGSHLARLFIYTPPRFHFSRAEQRLLKHALTGETCDDVAASLALSPWTVKKRWQAIYERVEAVDGELLPRAMAEGSCAHSRGAERRRRLLTYLRQHPEELRPFESSRMTTDRVTRSGNARTLSGWRDPAYSITPYS